ncbi:VOC family protein [Paractinoplanes ferrugineus]|uniref:Glyoxalase-like domain-containing protein n=1 Tax=Paractinoplanes ferrugineus TaxID=113564 RepID=A0A919J2M5_9ACTN|nr:VOC family protein [Actinoplanes ferrugineus]GIE11349.1 hypothetical protein Afe05nite_31890 [Actinoplanes ferrugineus]
MATRFVQINMKARDDAALGGFWAGALGWAMSSEGPGVTNLEPVGFDYPDPAAVCIDLVVSAEPKTTRNRVRLELAATSEAERAELIGRLTELGATPAGTGPGEMVDPEGNEFRVVDSSGPATGPIAAMVVDCADPRAMAGFWGAATDWIVHEVGDQEAVLRSAKGVGPWLRFVRTAEEKTGWNRVHLDVRPYPGDDMRAEAVRLRALGATAVDLGDAEVSWTVLADPEGNEFCVLAPA